MALGGTPRALHVAAADSVAKARRATDAASASFSPWDTSYAPSPYSANRQHVFQSKFDNSDSVVSASSSNGRKFGRAPIYDVRVGDSGKQSLLSVILESLGVPQKQLHTAEVDTDTESETQHGPAGVDRARRSSNRQSRRRVRFSEQNEDPRSKLQNQLSDAGRKALPTLEKTAVVVSNAPDPTIFYLVEIFGLLLIYVSRPHWLEASPLVPIAAVAFFILLLPVSVIWRKTDFIASLREGQNPLVHPAEDAIGDLEADLDAREKEIARQNASLKRSRRQLEDLKKELAKDLAVTPDSFVVPNKRASELIAAGALGPSYDQRTTEAAEAIRKAESKAKAQREWRQKADETEDTSDETREQIQNLVVHASKVYSARTKEIRVRTQVGSTNPAASVVGHLKPLRSGLAKVGIPVPGRESRDSSGNSSRNSNGSNDDSAGKRRSRPGFDESASARSSVSSIPQRPGTEAQLRGGGGSQQSVSNGALRSSTSASPGRPPLQQGQQLRGSRLSEPRLSNARASSAASEASSYAADGKSKRKFFRLGRKKSAVAG